MKKLLLSSVALAAMAGSAIAADLPSQKAPPVVAPAPLWTGFYAGLNAGGTWANNNTITFSGLPSYILPGSLPTNTATNGQYAFTDAILASRQLQVSNAGGFIGGGQIGYNWAFLEKGLFGLETDFQGLATGNSTSTSYASSPVPDNNHSANGFAGISANRSLGYFGTVRGRIGYLLTPTIQAYATAGFAYGGTNLTGTSFQTITVPVAIHSTANLYYGSQPFSGVSVGWTAGGGVEWMLAQNWSVKAEYLYYDLGSVQTLSGATSRFHTGPDYLVWTNQTSAQTRFNGNIVRAGANYHFNFASSPVVAKF
jgi:outer membrane immunogenic protein